ncbi:MAG TPA: hypothetical protein PKA64_05540 [Myxococcota bacterium]|nr:hypothetical protein [Myxococcota bacterium]
MATSLAPWVAPELRVEIGDTPSFNGTQQALTGVVSLRVDQLHTGVSTLDLTILNAAFQSTTTTTELGARPAPVTPPYRFNDFKTLNFGKYLKVYARYAGGGEASSTSALHVGHPKNTSYWTPLILARVTNLKFSLTGTGGQTVNVQGEDLLSLLKVTPEKDKNWTNALERDIADGIRGLVYASAGVPLASPLVADSAVSTRLRSKHQGKTQDHFQFLQSLADELDYEMFVAFDLGTAQATAKEVYAAKVELHFERARSQGFREHEVVDLVYGKNIVNFQPSFQVWEQLTKVQGKMRDPGTSDAAAATAASDAIKLDTPPADRSRFLDAATVRRSLGANAPAENVGQTRGANLDAARARRKAERELLKRARKFLTVEIDTIGMPSLRPGIFVKVHGFEAPFDGYYYVEKARHTIDSGGYKTSVSVRRPGYTDPNAYPVQRST